MTKRGFPNLPVLVLGLALAAPAAAQSPDPFGLPPAFFDAMQEVQNARAQQALHDAGAHGGILPGGSSAAAAAAQARADERMAEAQAAMAAAIAATGGQIANQGTQFGGPTGSPAKAPLPNTALPTAPQPAMKQPVLAPVPVALPPVAAPSRVEPSAARLPPTPAAPPLKTSIR
jgi:hypothetical protein